VITRTQVMQARTLQEATYMANKLAEEMQIYSDADCLVPKVMIQEMMPDRGWNDTIRDDKTGAFFRRKVSEKLVIQWKHRKTQEVAMEVSQEVENLVKEKLKKAGVSCATMEQMSLSAWKKITRPGRDTIYS
jgi:hypothetical protein